MEGKRRSKLLRRECITVMESMGAKKVPSSYLDNLAKLASRIDVNCNIHKKIIIMITDIIRTCRVLVVRVLLLSRSVNEFSVSR